MKVSIAIKEPEKQTYSLAEMRKALERLKFYKEPFHPGVYKAEEPHKHNDKSWFLVCLKGGEILFVSPEQGRCELLTWGGLDQDRFYHVEGAQVTLDFS